MKKGIKRALFFLLMLAMLSNVAIAQGGAAGELPLFEETVSLTIGVAQNANVEDFDTNWMTQYLEKTANVDLTFITYPSGEMNTQINLAISAGSKLPDILFISPGLDLLYQWALAGAVVPITLYIQEDGYYIYDAINRTGLDFLTYITLPDGEIYGFPQYNQSLNNESPSKIWIYGPWLEALSLDVPNTPDELYEVLKAFKTRDPNGNGEADEIPVLDFATHWKVMLRALVSPFEYVHNSNWYTVKDGQVGFVVTTDGFREGLVYMRKLFDEGLIDPMSFTIDKAQWNALVNAQVPVVGLNVDAIPGGTVGTDRLIEYKGIQPLMSEDGVRITPYAPSLPSVAGIITSSCADPQSAFRFLDLLMSYEVAIINHWGEEGVHWKYADEDAVSPYADMGYDASFEELIPIWGTVQNIMWRQVGPWVRDYSVTAGRVMPADPRTSGAVAATIQWAYSAAYPEEGTYVPTLIFTEEESEIVSMVLSELNTYTDAAIANFCLNAEGMDVHNDAAWANYLAQLDQIGMNRILPTLQTVYDRMYSE